MKFLTMRSSPTSPLRTARYVADVFFSYDQRSLKNTGLKSTHKIGRPNGWAYPAKMA